MRAALVLTLLAVLGIGYAAAQGELRVALVFIFPVFYGEGPWAFAAILLVFAAGLGWFFSLVGRGRPVREAPEPSSERRSPAGERRHGGIVMIGPLPIVWGSDRGMTRIVVAVALVLLVTGLVWWWVR